MKTNTVARPRIWAVGISRLRELFIDIAGTYAERADLDVVSLGYEDAVAAIESSAEQPDAIVAGGSNGAYLKSRVSVPVVIIGPTGFDVMHALAKARVASRTSVAAAFETALEVTQAMRSEIARRHRLDNLLQHLRDGVVAVDAQGRIEAINRRLAVALGLGNSSRIVGRPLLDVAPGLDGVLPAADGDAFGNVRGIISYAIHIAGRWWRTARPTARSLRSRNRARSNNSTAPCARGRALRSSWRVIGWKT